MNGYLSPLYAESLAEFGTPLHLPRSGGWLLVRPIPESTEHDAVGCYPLFNCRNWPALDSDLEGLAAQAVAVSLVVDPFSRSGRGAASWLVPRRVPSVQRTRRRRFRPGLAAGDLPPSSAQRPRGRAARGSGTLCRSVRLAGDLDRIVRTPDRAPRRLRHRAVLNGQVSAGNCACRGSRPFAPSSPGKRWECFCGTSRTRSPITTWAPSVRSAMRRGRPLPSLTRPWRFGRAGRALGGAGRGSRLASRGGRRAGPLQKWLGQRPPNRLVLRSHPGLREVPSAGCCPQARLRPNTFRNTGIRRRRDLSAPNTRELVAHYESCLRAHGDNHRGVDWPNAVDARTRYRVMLDVIRQTGSAGRAASRPGVRSIASVSISARDRTRRCRVQRASICRPSSSGSAEANSPIEAITASTFSIRPPSFPRSTTP